MRVKLLGRRRLCKLSDTTSSQCLPAAADHHGLQDVGSWETDEPTGGFRDEDGDHDDEEYHDIYSVEEELPDFEMEAVVGSGMAPFKLPARILNKLYPHQREGLDWLWSLHCRGKGGILGDDMGLGKTMQGPSLTLLNHPFSSTN
jgi:SNF2 family DNA or RNA helicase